MPNPNRARRNAKPGTTRLCAPENPVVPSLPKTRSWDKRTRSEWRSIWTSPMASMYTESDQEGLLKLMEMVDAFHSTDAPDMKLRLLSEIRLQRELYGLTPASRMRLGWEIEAETTPRRRLKPQTRGDARAVLGTQNVFPIGGQA